MSEGMSEAQLIAEYAAAIREVGHVNIYGAGAFGCALVSALLKAGIEVDFLIDRSITSTEFDRIPVVRPGSSDLDRSIPILISVMGYPEIVTSLESDGFLTVIPTELVFDLFTVALLIFTTDGSIWRSRDRDRHLDEGGIALLSGLLKDQKSHEVLTTLIAFRSSPSRLTYPWPDTHEWYFPPDIPLYPTSGSISVIDCGAYDGDSLRAYLEHFGERITDYLAIEANPKNAKVLSTWVQENTVAAHSEGAGIRVSNVAVSDRRGEILLSDEGTASTYFTCSYADETVLGDGLFTVVTAPIDDLAWDTDWTLIKMDIEGAEYEALLGARNLIADQHPALAISVYHRPDDLWRLPMLVDSLAPEAYDFYLRLEGHWGSETVCYAVPKLG